MKKIVYAVVIKGCPEIVFRKQKKAIKYVDKRLKSLKKEIKSDGEAIPRLWTLKLR